MKAFRTRWAGTLPTRTLWHTLRFRFALWVAGLLIAVLVAYSVFMYVSQSRGLLALVDESLRLTATQTIAAINIENGRMDLSAGIPAEFADAVRERGLTIRILGLTGNTLQSFGPYQNAPLDQKIISAALREHPMYATFLALPPGQSVRIYAAPISDNSQVIGVVQVGQALTSTQEALDNLLKTLLIGLPLLVLVGALGGYFLAARALAPIDQMTRTARRISAENLSARLNLPATDDEVGRLASTFDIMLVRLDNSFRRERQFVSDASHELRTPLAALQTILNVMRTQRRTIDDYEQALDDLSEEAGRLQALVENLLQLARSDTPGSAPRELVSLSNLLSDVAESLRPLAESKGLTLACSVPEGLVLVSELDSLIRLFVNLLDNAIKFTERGCVTLRAQQSQTGMVQITVADTGIGIAKQHLPHIFDRFYRVDPSRTTPGSGLGLAIAAQIAQTHGGTIAVNSTPGTGTAFVVQLPVSPATK
jgi:heavy metal sensor kinase